VLFDLASRPEYIQSLRDEVEQVIQEDGMELDEYGNPFIRKSSFQKMWKLDSFVKESQRWNPLGFGELIPRQVVSALPPDKVKTSVLGQL